MVTDPLTGEVIDERMLSDDELWEHRERLKLVKDTVSQAIAMVESEALRRLKARNATKMQTENFEVSLKKSVSRSYDLPTLIRLKDHLDDETFTKVMRPTYDPCWAELKKLLPFGGAIQRIVRLGVLEEEGRPQFEVKRKAVSRDIQELTEHREDDLEEVPF